MKLKNSFLFAFLLLAASALAQTTDSQTTIAATKKDATTKQIVLARCAYSQTDEACAVQQGVPPASDRGTNSTVAQLPRRMPGPLVGPSLRRAAYPGMWMSQPSPGHVLIGAIVGFGVGVAAGAGGNAGVRGSIAIGTIFSLIGAGIGASAPSFPSRRYYRHRWPDEDEEASRSKPGPSKPDPAKSEQANLGQTRSDQSKSDQASSDQAKSDDATLDSADQTTRPRPPSQSTTGADDPVRLAEIP